MLAYYQTQTARLLQNPSAQTPLYSTTDLTSWINTARGQLAGEAECIRVISTIQTVVGQRNYNFSSIIVPSGLGVQGVIHVRRIMYNVGAGQKFITPHEWEWFDLYHMNNPVPVNGPPISWSQYGQGGSGQSIPGIGGGSVDSGSFYLDPPPDLIYTLNCDCVFYPQVLAADTDIEAIPYLFTDAVPFFAAYYALLSAQMNARMADAERMFNYYQTFLQRARQASNPSVNRTLYQQANDPTKLTKLGLQKAANQ